MKKVRTAHRLTGRNGTEREHKVSYQRLVACVPTNGTARTNEW
ncbi:MAG: hypothetical protein SPI30_01915 [Prevotella sp.]|nr:hypothetical protein [Prevotella sp.]